MLSNYFSPTPKNLLKISLALRAMVGTIAGAAYFQDNKNAAFWFLVGGAAIEFFIQCLQPSKEDVNKTASMLILLVAGSALFLSGCRSTKESSSSRIDTTYITYKPVDMQVKGSSVSASTNIDSLLTAFRASLPAQGHDSTIIKEHWNTTPVIITDSSSKIQLKYWVDQYGKLVMECTSKDQTIQMLVAQVNKLSKENHTETIIKYKPNWLTWTFLGWAIAATALIVIAIMLKSLRFP